VPDDDDDDDDDNAKVIYLPLRLDADARDTPPLLEETHRGRVALRGISQQSGLERC
jgi:hypothetical protein